MYLVFKPGDIFIVFHNTNYNDYYDMCEAYGNPWIEGTLNECMKYIRDGEI